MSTKPDLPSKKRRKQENHQTDSHPAKKVKKTTKKSLSTDLASPIVNGRSEKTQQAINGRPTAQDDEASKTSKTSKTGTVNGTVQTQLDDMGPENQQSKYMVSKERKGKRNKTKATKHDIPAAAAAAVAVANAFSTDVNRALVFTSTPPSSPSSSWLISEPIGGLFRPRDPVFTADET
jgi:hypothetical protein